MSNLSDDEKIQARVREIREQFEKRIKAIQEDGAKRIQQVTDESPTPSSVEAVLNITFDVKWKTTAIKFDIPKFSMQLETVKFDIPEVRMELEEMTFDVPSTKMVNKCIAKKPEFHGFRVKWTCIYAKVPEVYMKRVSIKTDIPKFTTKRFEMKFDKPVVKMETTEIKLELPQFFLRSVDAQVNASRTQLEQISAEMTAEVAVAQAELKERLRLGVGEEVAGMFDRLREEILAERANVAKSYDDAIAKTKAAISVLKQNNVPDKVSELEGKLSAIVAEYQAVLVEIDRAIDDLNKKEEEAIRGLALAE